MRCRWVSRRVLLRAVDAFVDPPLLVDDASVSIHEDEEYSEFGGGVSGEEDVEKFY